MTPTRIARGLARRARTYGRRLALQAWTTTRTVAYGADARCVLDVIQPRRPARDRPIVVVFHGGGWTEGSRASLVDRVCRRYLEHGFVVANVGYRHGLVHASEDAVRALAWVHASFAGEVIVTGESAGAQLALLAAFTSPRRVRGVVDFYAPTDLVRFAHARADRSLPASGRDAVLARLSPITHVRPGLPPVLAIHGTADPLVPLDHTTDLVRRLREVGGVAETILVDGGDHGFTETELDAIYPRILSKIYHQE